MTETNYIKIGARTKVRELTAATAQLADKLLGVTMPTTQEVVELRKLIDALLEAIEVYSKT